MKGRPGPATTLLRPILDTYRDSAVALVGCKSRGLDRYSCEYDVIVLAGAKQPPTSLRIGDVFVDLTFSSEGEILKPGGAWIAPGDFHMRLVREGNSARLTMNQEPPQNSCRPSVDVLFESAAQSYGGNVLGVVLTGMGCDGLRGAQCIRDAGGQVIVQDEASSVVWGMPGSVAAAGLANGVFSLGELAGEIEQRANWNRVSGDRKALGRSRTWPPPNTPQILKNHPRG